MVLFFHYLFINIRQIHYCLFSRLWWLLNSGLRSIRWRLNENLQKFFLTLLIKIFEIANNRFNHALTWCLALCFFLRCFWAKLWIQVAYGIQTWEIFRWLSLLNLIVSWRCIFGSICSFALFQSVHVSNQFLSYYVLLSWWLKWLWRRWDVWIKLLRFLLCWFFVLICLWEKLLIMVRCQ